MYAPQIAIRSLDLNNLFSRITIRSLELHISFPQFEQLIRYLGLQFYIQQLEGTNWNPREWIVKFEGTNYPSMGMNLLICENELHNAI